MSRQPSSDAPSSDQPCPELGCYGLAGHTASPADLLDEVRAAEDMGLGSLFLSERFNVKDAGVLAGAAAAAPASTPASLTLKRSERKTEPSPRVSAVRTSSSRSPGESLCPASP